MTFVRTISGLRDGAVFRPWLRTVAVNAARACGREERRRKIGMRWDRGVSDADPRSPDGDSGQTAVRSPQAEVAGRERATKLMDLATELPDGYREPLLLKCLQGMSYREIGRVMGLPESTIETRIARGRRMLRELATKSGDADGRAASEKEGVES